MTVITKDSWNSLFTQIGTTGYFKELDSFLQSQYKDSTIYPKQSEIYKPFQLCKYPELKVVILSYGLYHNGRATGLPFANSKKVLRTVASPPLKMIETAVVDYYAKFTSTPITLNYTLEDWAEQGVLLLNTSMTVRSGEPHSHDDYWAEFIRSVLLNLSINNSGIIYLLWGSIAKNFEKYINKDKNFVLYNDHPMTPLLMKKDKWECNHFKFVNKVLKNNKRIIW